MRRGGPQVFQCRQRAGIDDPVRANPQDHVITTKLALFPDAAGNPPHGRVIEHERLHQNLEGSDEIIVAENVSQFMRQDRFELSRREAGDGAGGQ